jgi:hypothetical protein
VLFNGQIMGDLDGESADILTIGEMMMGRQKDEILADVDLERKAS